MKILLLNDNPVVNKLVTLSAQKTSDELDIATAIEDVAGNSYDLIVVDDGIGGDEIFDALKDKFRFSRTLYIRARDSKEPQNFNATLKKPFLPTDLVELFSMFDKEIANSEEEVVEPIEKIEESSMDLSEIDDLEELGDFDDIALDEQLELDTDALELDVEGADEDMVVEFDDLDETLLDEDLGESVLDDEEAQKVKDLLDETSSDDELILDDESPLSEEESIHEEIGDSLENDIDDFELAVDLEDEADVDIAEDETFDTILELDEDKDKEMEALESADEEELEDLIDADVTEELAHKKEEEALLEDEELAYDEALDMEDEADVDIAEDEELLALDDLSHDIEETDALEEIAEEALFEEEEEMIPEEENSVENDDVILEEDKVDELEIEPDNIEQQIQEAVEDLSEEDLESEVDDETLLNIAASEIDSLDNLSSKDLKLALGEEIEDDELIEEEVLPELDEEDVEELIEAAEAEEEQEESVGGVEALKKLLVALSDKDVLASMKGMKITINIELDNK